MSISIPLFGFIVFILSLASGSQNSYSNCPTSFNVTAANTTTDENILLVKQGSTLYGGYMNPVYQKKLQSIVVQGNQQQLSSFMYSLAIPYILIGVAYTAIIFTMIVCCLFDKTCPPCPRLRRDLAKNPYKKSQLGIVGLFSFIFGAAAVVTSLIAFTAVPQMKTHLAYTKCSLYVTLDAALEGDTTTGWGGFQAVNDKLGNISASLNSASTFANSYFLSNSWLIDDMTKQLTKNLGMYSKYQNSTLKSPDPNTTTDINSVFISTGLGPNGTLNTMVTDIDNGLRTTQKLADTAYEVDQAAKAMVDSVSLIQNNVILARNQLNNYAANLDTFTDELKLLTSEGDQKFTYVLYVMEAVLAVVMMASMVGLLGIIATHCFEILTCRHMVHLSWVLLGLSGVGMVAMSYLFFPAASLANHFCNYYSNALTNRSEFQRLTAFYSENVLGKVEVCLFDDGNMLETFNAKGEMYTVSHLFDEISSFTDMTNPLSSVYVDLSIAENKIAGWRAAMLKYRDGVYIDNYANQTSDRNPQYSLKTLNDYTLRSLYGCNVTKDEWVFDETNCTSTQKFSPGVTNTNGLLIPTSPWCISFNSSMIQNTPIWDLTDFTTRYNQIALATNCSGAYNAILKYGKALINFRDSRIKLFQSMYDDMTALKGLNDAFNLNLATFKDKVQGFTTSVTTLNSLVNNKVSGLNVASNCSIIGDYMRFTYNSFCINFMSQAIKVGICCLILVITVFAASITMNIFAVRYSQIEKDTYGMAEEGLEDLPSNKDSEVSIQDD